MHVRFCLNLCVVDVWGYCYGSLMTGNNSFQFAIPATPKSKCDAHFWHDVRPWHPGVMQRGRVNIPRVVVPVMWCPTPITQAARICQSNCYVVRADSCWCNVTHHCQKRKKHIEMADVTTGLLLLRRENVYMQDLLASYSSVLWVLL